ncbi:MAG TPA: dehydrogenase [Planctomycetaceae bacterium]|nr:dehydrogenase [Planctomycetaceae bacterium]
MWPPEPPIAECSFPKDAPTSAVLKKCKCKNYKSGGAKRPTRAARLHQSRHGASAKLLNFPLIQIQAMLRSSCPPCQHIWRILTFSLFVTTSIVSSVGLVSNAWSADAAAQDHAVVEALLRLPGKALEANPTARPAVLRYLSSKSGTKRYLEVAQKLGVTDQKEELLKFIEAGDSNLTAQATRLLMQSGGFNLLKQRIEGEDRNLAAKAARALGFTANQAVRDYLHEKLTSADTSAQVKIAAVEALGANKAGQQVLLATANKAGIPEGLTFAYSEALRGSTDDEIRAAAEKVLQPIASKSSEQLPPVKLLARQRGNAKQGKQVFNSVGTCNQCHKVGGEGKEVGPDLSEIGSKLSREDMYVAILNPSAAVSHNYETYSVLDIDGNVISGLLINRNDAAVTIRDNKGVDHTIASEDVEEFQQQEVSLMPADLQKLMTKQELVSLVDYLVLLRKKDEQGFNAIAGNTPPENVRDPSTAVAGFDIADGLQVELWASEPMMLSPTSIDVDHLGRVWVCEAVNYRHFRNHQNEPREKGDRILVLEDTDGDGKADKRTVFYQGRDIDSPHGVTVLGEQVIVSAGENVIVFTDHDGDLKPDSRRNMFTGISGVQHDHGIHAFNIGPDGKLYFNFGNEGKQLKGPDGETIVDKAGNVVDDSRNPYQQGMVFRCNLDGSELETIGWNFRNNWEVCVDSFGNLWQSDNDDDGNRGTRINFVMEFGNYGYRDQRNGDTWKVPRTGLEGEIPLQHWHLNDPGVVPNILQTGAGSPTGICFYEGDLLPAQFRNQIIHTDPGPNVVRAYPVENDGAGFQASILNLVKGVRDPWFRPVDVCAAPDGSLFVADWYDPGVGGHRMGDIQQGRIFRITPTGNNTYEVPSHDYSTPDGALAALKSANLATRFLAQQAIKQIGAPAVEALERVARGTAGEVQQARALWQIAAHGPSEQRAAAIEQAITDTSPNIVITGIRMARQHDADVLRIVSRLKEHPSSHVRRELLVALRHNELSEAKSLWVDLALQHDGKDRWYLEALGIAADGKWDDYFTAWLERVGSEWNTPAGRDIVWRCRSSKACEYLLMIIRSTNSEREQYRYFRAFDFHEGAPKTEALQRLLVGW